MIYKISLAPMISRIKIDAINCPGFEIIAFNYHYSKSKFSRFICTYLILRVRISWSTFSNCTYVQFLNTMSVYGCHIKLVISEKSNLFRQHLQDWYARNLILNTRVLSIVLASVIQIFSLKLYQLRWHTLYLNKPQSPSTSIRVNFYNQYLKPTAIKHCHVRITRVVQAEVEPL